nr:protein Flattop [Nerophis lumbriciformis]
MSSRYSANQYDDAFKSKRLQNWCMTKPEFKAPTARKGCTKFVADNSGHLLPGVVKKGSVWPDFKGTWDLPARIPAHKINPTSRSAEGLQRLKAWGLDPDHKATSRPASSSKKTDGGKKTDALQNAGKENSEGVQQDNASSVPPPTAETQPASQSRPVSADTKTGKQSVSQADEVLSVINAADPVTSKPASLRAMSSLSLEQAKTTQNK